MKTVLVTAVGSAAASAVRQSLKQAGHRAIGCDIYPQAWNVTSGEMDAFFNVPFATEESAYTEALLAAAREYGVTHILPLTDVEVDTLSPRKAMFATAGVTVCCPEPEVARLCRDKLRMADQLGQAGICPVIPTYTADTLPPGAAYPLMMKPLHGRSSQAQVIAHSPEEMRFALTHRDDYILQPFLTGEIFTVDCARDARGNVVTLARRECLRTVNGLGTAVETLPDHELNAVCRAIVTFAGVVGAVNIEFIQHEGAYFFLEVNPRFSGGVGFSCLAGYDFTEAMLRCHDGLALLPRPPLHAMTLAQRYEMRITREADASGSSHTQP